MLLFAELVKFNVKFFLQFACLIFVFFLRFKLGFLHRNFRISQDALGFKFYSFGFSFGLFDEEIVIGVINLSSY